MTPPTSSPLAVPTPVFALPVQTLWVYPDLSPRHGPVVGSDLLRVHRDDVLALVVVDQVHVL